MMKHLTAVGTAKLLTACCLSLVLIGASFSVNAQSRRVGEAGFTLQVPYIMGKKLGFDGGARAEIKDDAGFGMGLTYNYSEHIALNAYIDWNSLSYDIERVTDSGTTEFLKSKLDTFNLGFGADYYFSTENLTPFISGVIGTNYIDSNIPSGPPSSVCWWDPWFGWVCRGGTPTHDEWTWFGGYGAGLRLEFGQSSFLKLGWYQNYMNYDNASGSSEVESYRLELGFKF